MQAISVDRLVKEYRNGVRALDELSFSVAPGEIFGLLGPNGAGKSTLIRILTTCARPSGGSARIGGKDVVKEAAWVRRHIACVAQQVSLDTHLSLAENFWLQSRLYRVEPALAKQRTAALIAAFDLGDYLNQPVVSYSGGVKRRLDIALQLLAAPEVLFLDEPTVGMDAAARQAMWRMLRTIRDEYRTTIVLTTHYLEEADQLSDTLCIMHKGRCIAQDSPAALRAYTRQPRLHIAFATATARQQHETLLADLRGIRVSQREGRHLWLHSSDAAALLPEVGRRLLTAGVQFTTLEVAEPSLEAVFLALTATETTSEAVSAC